MKSSNGFSVKSRIQSFGYALKGWQELLTSEPNAVLHIIAAAIAVTLGWYLHINATEWLFVVLAIVLVFAAELFNTALEVLCNFVEPERHPQIKKIKDLSAGAVLMLSIGALLIGLIIFIPKFC